MSYYAHQAKENFEKAKSHAGGGHSSVPAALAALAEGLIQLAKAVGDIESKVEKFKCDA